MRKTVALPYVFVALASLIVAGCGGGYGQTAATANASPTPFPSPTASCTPPAGYTIQEVFPQNGGTAVANLQGVVFAIGPSPQPGGVPSPLPTNWYYYVVSAAGTSAFSNSITPLATPTPQPGSTAGATPLPLPTPSDSPKPGFTNYLFETATVGNFANNTSFTVYLANTSCFPGLPESTFTTAPTDTPTVSSSPTAVPT
jgi:hypothetical protein